MVKVWLSMKDEDRKQAQVKEPTLKALLQALQDIECFDVMAQITEAGGKDTEYGALEAKDDRSTKGAASANEISRWPIEIPELSSDSASNVKELEKGKSLQSKDGNVFVLFRPVETEVKWPFPMYKNRNGTGGG